RHSESRPLAPRAETRSLPRPRKAHPLHHPRRRFAVIFALGLFWGLLGAVVVLALMGALLGPFLLKVNRDGKRELGPLKIGGRRGPAGGPRNTGGHGRQHPGAGRHSRARHAGSAGRSVERSRSAQRPAGKVVDQGWGFSSIAAVQMSISSCVIRPTGSNLPS